jgi:hypothetical protein
MNAIGPGDRIPVIVVGAVLGVFALTFLATTVSVTIYKLHKTRLEIGLKRELLERGMSADEIAVVISARPSRAAINEYHRTLT